ncbi:hypothetical protein [Maridesulfovibrio sp.]|uniref:hypothetical protein n=1 Tax=Maridesulfovibrio sp. TaxID=2795000 RepID=UPI0029CA868B|nr:hypothetical protein [Maridesulfovibrio sp.]
MKATEVRAYLVHIEVEVVGDGFVVADVPPSGLPEKIVAKDRDDLLGAVIKIAGSYYDSYQRVLAGDPSFYRPSEGEMSWKDRKLLTQWLDNGRRGVSSNAIATRLSGIGCGAESPFGNYPHDPSDFLRCEKLLDAVPSFRDRLDEMREESPEWAALVDAWEEIRFLIDLDRTETPERAPRAYKRMHEICEGAREA